MFANARGPRVTALLALWLAFAGPADAANRRIFSYDPADAATREAAGQLTFEFNQKLLSTRVLRVRSTEESATADLKPAPPDAVPGGVSRLMGPQARERDLYQILAADDGPAMISAFCPGARRAWMAFGHLRANQDLRVYVLGDFPRGGARLCRSLRFTYHGEWRLPPGPLMDPDTLPVDRRPF